MTPRETDREAADVLEACAEKLALYRGAHSGEYVGGVEYTELVGRINRAIALLRAQRPSADDALGALPAKWREEAKHQRPRSTDEYDPASYADEREANTLEVCADELSAAMNAAGVVVPASISDKLADGWVVEWEPDTGFIGLRHPHGGRMSVAQIYGFPGLGEYMLAALAAPAGVSEDAALRQALAESFDKDFGFWSSPTASAVRAKLWPLLSAALSPMEAKKESE